jgi:hypothetical protein
MSWAYWGIVGTLVTLVGMLLACFRLLSPKGKQPLPTQSERPDVPSSAARRARDHLRKAA